MGRTHYHGIRGWMSSNHLCAICYGREDSKENLTLESSMFLKIQNNTNRLLYALFLFQQGEKAKQRLVAGDGIEIITSLSCGRRRLNTISGTLTWISSLMGNSPLINWLFLCQNLDRVFFDVKYTRFHYICMFLCFLNSFRCDFTVWWRMLLLH